MVYVMYSNQYVDLLKNGPDNSTVIVSTGSTLSSDGHNSAEFFLENNIVISVTIQEPYIISVYKDEEQVIQETPVTDEFGAKWLDMAQDVTELDFALF